MFTIAILVLFLVSSAVILLPICCYLKKRKSRKGKPTHTKLHSFVVVWFHVYNCFHSVNVSGAGPSVEYHRTGEGVSAHHRVSSNDSCIILNGRIKGADCVTNVM